MATLIRAPLILSYADKPNCAGCVCRKKDAVGRGTGRGPAVHLLCFVKRKHCFFQGKRFLSKKKRLKAKKMPYIGIGTPRQANIARENGPFVDVLPIQNKQISIAICHLCRVFLFGENFRYLGLSPFPVTVTTRIITFLVGDPYKPSFATVRGQPKI